MIQKTRIHAGLLLSLALSLTSVAVMAEAPAPEPPEAKYEVEFLTGMIDHHAMAVMMTMHCEETAVHEDLIALCQEMAATQTAEIELMQGWLLDWYGLVYEPSMTQGEMQRMHRLHHLSGVEFEIAFMQMMIRHHAGAVREGSKCIDRAFHSDLIELCHDMVVVQAEEIALLQSWLCGWYGICNVPSRLPQSD